MTVTPSQTYPHILTLIITQQNLALWTVSCVSFEGQRLRLIHELVLHLIQHQWPDANFNSTRGCFLVPGVFWSFRGLFCFFCHPLLPSFLGRDKPQKTKNSRRDFLSFEIPFGDKSSLLFWREASRLPSNQCELTCPSHGGHSGNGKGTGIPENFLSQNNGSHKQFSIFGGWQIPNLFTGLNGWWGPVICQIQTRTAPKGPPRLKWTSISKSY